MEFGVMIGTIANRTDIEGYRKRWQAATDSAALYRTLARTGNRADAAQLYEQLALSEEINARFWAGELRAAMPLDTMPASQSWHSHLVVWLGKRLGH
jgi:hypothetical protein